MSTKKYQKNIKYSDKFYKINLMKILEVLEYEELTWSQANWSKYGISNSDQKKIEQDYKNYQFQKHKKNSCILNKEDLNK